MSAWSCIAWTVLALLAFAGNSLLCRAALGAPSSIDAASFTALRIASGALILAPVLLRAPSERVGAVASEAIVRSRPWASALALAVYAVAFSFSYTRIGAGVGALVLFACVQLTMLAVARWEGDALGARRSFGAALAFGGLLVPLLPSGDALGSVDGLGVLLMAIAGVGWGFFTLLGRGVAAPTRSNARNFAVALPFVLVPLIAVELEASARGLALATASGALCSGLGYAVWYRALRGHTAVSAALCQLAVPILAAVLAWILLAEALTVSWGIATAMVLGGIALGLRPRP